MNLDYIFFKKQRTIFWSIVVISLVINTSSWLWIYFNVPQEAYPFIIHYNIDFGRDILGSKTLLFQIPFTGTIILALNTLISWLLLKRSRPISWLIILSTFFMQLLILYGVAVIVYVNT